MGRMHDALKKAAEERDRKRTAPPVSPLESLGRFGTRSPRRDQEVVDPDAVDTRAMALPETKTQSVSDEPEPTTIRMAVEAPVSDEIRTFIAEDPVSFEELVKRSKPAAKRAPAPVRERRDLTDTETRHRARNLDERIVAFHNPRDQRAEQFRVLRANLLSLRPAPKSMLVTSAIDDDGCALMVLNLATAFSEETMKRVLVIDANLRAPRLATMLGVRQSPGFREMVEGSETDIGGLIQRTAIPGVDVIAGGEIPRNPGGYIVSRSLAAVIAAVEEDYDYVLIEAPALHQFADACVMAPETDGVLLVVRIGAMPKTETTRAIEALEAARARVLGSVIMDAR